MKRERSKNKTAGVLAGVIPGSQAELIAMIEAEWLLAETELLDPEAVFHALHEHLDQLAARHRRPLPVIYV